MTWEAPEFDTLDEVMAAMHEGFRSALRAGFTRHQALHIVMGKSCCEREDLD